MGWVVYAALGPETLGEMRPVAFMARYDTREEAEEDCESRMEGYLKSGITYEVMEEQEFEKRKRRRE